MDDAAVLDRMIWSLQTDIAFLDRITPVNMQQERDRFLDHREHGAVYTPSFSYDTASYPGQQVAETLQDCREQLRSTAFHTQAADTLRQLYTETIDTLAAMHQALTHRGDGIAVRDAAQIIYGPPPQGDEVAEAVTLLESIRDRDIDTPEDASTVRSACTDALDRVGLASWSVRYTETGITSASAAEQAINVPHPATGQRYRQGEPPMVAAHEVSHALRAANGYRQPYKVFGTGAGRYQPTDEGLAILLEFAVGRSRPELLLCELRKYALRVLAADSVTHHEPFSDTVERLLQFTDNTALCWRITARAYRGGDGAVGGIAKDHLYYRGLRDVAAHLDDTPSMTASLATLYAGKYGIDRMETVHDLIDADILSPAQHTPERLVDTELLALLAHHVSSSNIGGILLPLQRQHM